MGRERRVQMRTRLETNEIVEVHLNALTDLCRDYPTMWEQNKIYRYKASPSTLLLVFNARGHILQNKIELSPQRRICAAGEIDRVSIEIFIINVDKINEEEVYWLCSAVVTCVPSNSRKKTVA